MIVLDTDILSIVQRATGPEYRRLVARLAGEPGDRPVVVTMVSFEEQMRGWMAFLARTPDVDRQVTAYARLQLLLQDYQSRPLLGFDRRAADVSRELRSERVRIGTMDLKIASVALAHDAFLLSRNLADFRKVPRLRVEDWTGEPAA